MPAALRNIFVQITAALFILLFIYTAISKLRDQPAFVMVLHKSPLIGSFAVIMATLLPVLEIIIAMLLFIPASKQAGLLAAAVLMALFTAYIGYMIFFTPHLPCTCGGVINQLTWKQHFIFNIIFTSLACAGYRLEKNNKRFVATNRISRTPV